LTISTPSSTPAGTYQVTVVFDETVSGSSSGFILLPLLLLPVYLLRKRLTARGMWSGVGLGLILVGAMAFGVGCGGASSCSTATTTSSQSVTSSGVVGMKVQ
jgi:phosphoribosylformylglycinamidine (FGAM) synthase-like enzyme